MVLLLVISAIDGYLPTCVKGAAKNAGMMGEWAEATLERTPRRQR